MYLFIFTKTTQKLLSKFDNTLQERFLEKLRYLKQVDDINPYLKSIVGGKSATHRLRVGDYRIILKREDNTFYIIDIGHRKEIYKTDL